MERIKDLIKQLQEQLEQSLDPAAMIVTVKMLQTALEQAIASNNTPPSPSLGTAKVAVVLPSNNRQVPSVQLKSTVTEALPAIAVEEEVAALPPIPSVKEKEEKKSSEKHEKGNLFFGSTKETSNQPKGGLSTKELNDVIGESVNAASLNDRLRSSATELGDTLTDAPIKDLKKAIGVNDRYVFVSELFRGDEDMYERSVKTINSFRILQEADYWMERELKIKLAWDGTKEVTRHFYNLVRRRFS